MSPAHNYGPAMPDISGDSVEPHPGDVGGVANSSQPKVMVSDMRCIASADQ